jgi:hypothetical protein
VDDRQRFMIAMVYVRQVYCFDVTPERMLPIVAIVRFFVVLLRNNLFSIRFFFLVFVCRQRRARDLLRATAAANTCATDSAANTGANTRSCLQNMQRHSLLSSGQSIFVGTKNFDCFINHF